MHLRMIYIYVCVLVIRLGLCILLKSKKIIKLYDLIIMYNIIILLNHVI